MATTLSGPLRDTGGCLISQRFMLAAVSGRPLQKPLPVFAFSVAARFAAPDRFTAAESIRQRQVDITLIRAYRSIF
jgi:hypothetical protein